MFLCLVRPDVQRPWEACFNGVYCPFPTPPTPPTHPHTPPTHPYTPTPLPPTPHPSHPPPHPCSDHQVDVLEPATLTSLDSPANAMFMHSKTTFTRVTKDQATRMVGRPMSANGQHMEGEVVHKALPGVSE